jgi:hypothetical protein
MAEPSSRTSIVPSNLSSPSQPIDAEYVITVKEFDAAANKTEISCTLPTSANFADWSVKQQVIMLKKGAWAKSTIPEIMWGIAYANKLGLDIMQGDVYSVGDGRIATSNKAKIKMALATGKIKGFTTEIVDTKKPIDLTGCIQKTDLECTVTLEVEGFNKPIIRKALLSRWFTARNPNWVGRPEHMLELNTMAHACEYVHPTETGPDEAPPLNPTPTHQQSSTQPPVLQAEIREEPSLLEQLHESVEKVNRERTPEIVAAK